MGLLPNETTYGKIWIENNKMSIHKEILDYTFNGCDLGAIYIFYLFYFILFLLYFKLRTDTVRPKQ
jgi:hypothetical protein